MVTDALALTTWPVPTSVAVSMMVSVPAAVPATSSEYGPAPQRLWAAGLTDQLGPLKLPLFPEVREQLKR